MANKAIEIRWLRNDRAYKHRAKIPDPTTELEIVDRIPPNIEVRRRDGQPFANGQPTYVLNPGALSKKPPHEQPAASER